jgi:mono/diheme cytochrome c family protein
MCAGRSRSSVRRGMMRVFRNVTVLRVVGCVICVALVGVGFGAEQGVKPQAGAAGLNAEVREILTQHCVKCHGGEKTTRGRTSCRGTRRRRG